MSRIQAATPSSSMIRCVVPLLGAIALLVTCIPAGQSAPPRAGEMTTSASIPIEFRAIADRVVRVPAREHETPVRLALEIVNRGRQPYVFKRLDTIFITLIDSAGDTLRMDGGRNGTTAGAVHSGAIHPGRSLTIDRTARLSWVDGALRLSGSDGFGGEWYIDGLAAGAYRIQMVYENRDETLVQGIPQWTGKALTQPREVRLR
jgi:hypothetical protein